MGIFDKKPDHEKWVDEYLFENRLIQELSDFLGTTQYSAFKKSVIISWNIKGLTKLLNI